MKRGFTLIEILLALLVLSIGIVSVVGVLSSALYSTEKAQDDLDMVSFADMVMNHCHSIENWAALPTSGNLSLQDYNQMPQNIVIGAPGGQFTSSTILPDGSTIDRYTLTYELKIQRSSNTKIITLKVWPGFNTSGPPRAFHTEVYNWDKR